MWWGVVGFMRKVIGVCVCVCTKRAGVVIGVARF